MTFEEIISGDFEIRRGRITKRNGSYTNFELRKFGWGVIEYHMINGSTPYGDYSVKKDAYGDWYLYKGYKSLIRLYYLGGEDWNSYR